MRRGFVHTPTPTAVYRLNQALNIAMLAYQDAINEQITWLPWWYIDEEGARVEMGLSRGTEAHGGILHLRFIPKNAGRSASRISCYYFERYLTSESRSYSEEEKKQLEALSRLRDRQIAEEAEVG